MVAHYTIDALGGVCVSFFYGVINIIRRGMAPRNTFAHRVKWLYTELEEKNRKQRKRSQISDAFKRLASVEDFWRAGALQTEWKMDTLERRMRVLAYRG